MLDPLYNQWVQVKGRRQNYISSMCGCVTVGGE